MAEDSAEIFDDLYLGVRAGGALRKQRRGEELTHEEKEALSRWQRLSVARKAAAIGAFAFGTFGLGFTLGGLVFGRWRRASPPPRRSEAPPAMDAGEYGEITSVVLSVRCDMVVEEYFDGDSAT